MSFFGLGRSKQFEDIVLKLLNTVINNQNEEKIMNQDEAKQVGDLQSHVADLTKAVTDANGRLQQVATDAVKRATDGQTALDAIKAAQASDVKVDLTPTIQQITDLVAAENAVAQAPAPPAVPVAPATPALPPPV